MPDKHSISLLEALPEGLSLMGHRTSNQMLGHAFDALPDGAFLFGSDRRLIKGNANAAQLQGDGLCSGRLCCEMFWQVEGADGCVVDRAIESGEKVEVEIQSGPEQKLSISIIVEPLGDDNGRRGALVIARDISDLRRAEAEAIAHKSFIASIADRTPDEIYALDSEARITWMNERAEAYKLLISPGGSFLELIAEDCRELAEENLRRTLAGKDTEYEVRVNRFDGSARYAEAHTSPLWKDGEIDGVLVFLRDVTERKREHEM